jgi:hypothetical protein
MKYGSIALFPGATSIRRHNNNVATCRYMSWTGFEKIDATAANAAFCRLTSFFAVFAVFAFLISTRQRGAVPNFYRFKN